MSSKFVAVDLTQHVPVVIDGEDGANGSENTTRAGIPPRLPAIILPHFRGEKALAGVAALEHRRGAGLDWPPEAQVPLDGDDSRGVGRVPLVAAWHRLAASEAGWGTEGSIRQPFSWQPEARSSGTQLYPAAAIAQSAASFADLPEGASIALVVPDRLDERALNDLSRELHGQTNAHAANADRLLLWRSAALALAWCKANESAFTHHKTEGSKPRSVGHIAVISLGMDLFELVVCGIAVQRVDDRRCLVPIIDRNIVNIRLGPWGITYLAGLADKAKSEGLWNTLVWSDWPSKRLAEATPISRHVRNEVEQGELPTSLLELSRKHSTLEQLFPHRPLGELADDHMSERGEFRWVPWLWSLLREQKEKLPKDESKEFLGAIVAGSSSALSIGVSKTLGQLCEQALTRVGAPKDKVVIGDELVASQGACEFLWRKYHGFPTYYERLVPIDIFAVQTNTRRDRLASWLPLVPGKMVMGGSKLEQQHEHQGLEIPEGSDQQHLTLRRGQHGDREGASAAVYRKVIAPLEEPTEKSEPVRLNVIVRPGQGYAQVEVESMTPELFRAYLDWERMEPTREPTISHAYISRVWEVESDRHRWRDAQRAAEEASRVARVGDPRFDKQQENLNGTLKNLRESYLAKRAAAEGEDYLYESLVGLDGHCSARRGDQILTALRQNLPRWLNEPHNNHDGLKKEIVRTCGWMYEGIPDEVLDHVRIELRRYIRAPQRSISDAYLTAVGNGFREPADIALFFEAFEERIHFMPEEGTNHWLRALRYLVQYREHTLSKKAAPAASLRVVTEHVRDRLADQHAEANYHHIFNNCLHILVFLLKRRRYEASFLDADEGEWWSRRAYDDIVEVLDEVTKGGRLSRCNDSQRHWASVVLKFLQRAASDQDLSRLLKLARELD